MNAEVSSFQCFKVSFYVVCILLASCNNKVDSITGIELSQLDGQIYSGKTIQDHVATVFTFYSPDCPLSEAYIVKINQFIKEYSSKNISFVSVFPGTYYPENTIRKFKNKYLLSEPALLDPKKKITNLLSATITPETFVVNSNGETIYSGAIDNWAVDLGQKRQVITEYYLRDALDALLQYQAVKINKTNAVGCFIE